MPFDSGVNPPKAALDQMETELDSAKQRLLDTYKDYDMKPPPGIKVRPDSGGRSSSGQSGKVQKWERAPDGSLRPGQ